MSAKTLYDSYENFNRDVPIINVDNILCETIKHVGCLWKICQCSEGVELKDLHCHKINFTGKIVIQTLFIESTHYLLLEETNVGEKISQMLFP